MIADFFRRPLGAGLFAVCLAVVGCQRVPLLAPTGSTLTLNSLTSALPLNGSTDIIAQLLEPAGTPPHQGTHVTFTTTLGRIEPSEAETDINGRITVKFIAGSASGTATVTAASGSANTGTNGSIKIAIGAAAVGQISVGANPTTVSGIGGASTITASVFDASGNALTGVPVTFTTDAGSVSPSIVTTDSAGKAQAILTTSKTAKVTATAGVATTSTGTGTGGTTTTTAPSATVTVAVNTTSSLTIGAPTPATPTVGQTVSFPLTYPTGATGASPVVRVDVDFGDGALQTFSGQPSSVSHAYSRAGSYLVQVIGFDSFGDRSTASASVTVIDKPLPTVTLSSSTTNPLAGQPVSFTVTPTAATGGSPIQRVTVDFGDGSPVVTLGATTSTVNHIYTLSGTYTVTATAIDLSGDRGTGTLILAVGNRPPANVTITADPKSPQVGVSVTFTITTTFPSGNTSAVQSVTVDFGDGSTATLGAQATATVQHAYQSPGTFVVTAVVRDTNGGSSSASTSVVVTPKPTPAVALAVSPNPSTLAQQPVSFTATVTQLPMGVTVDHYEWAFGDTSTRTTTSNTTSHAYTVPGTYSASVTAVMSDGTRSTSSTDVKVNP